MKKLMTICFLSIIAFNIQAQTTMDTVSAEICECIEGKDYSKMNSAEASQFAEECITKATVSNLAFFMEGVDQSAMGEDEFSNAMRKKGEAVAIHAAQNCPSFLQLMTVMANAEEEGQETVMTGELTAFDTENFYSITLEEADGRQHKLYWMEHFEGAMQLKNGKKNNLKKNIEVSYKNVESYNPKLEDYATIKVITGIIWK